MKSVEFMTNMDAKVSNNDRTSLKAAVSILSQTFLVLDDVNNKAQGKCAKVPASRSPFKSLSKIFISVGFSMCSTRNKFFAVTVAVLALTTLTMSINALLVVALVHKLLPNDWVCFIIF